MSQANKKCSSMPTIVKKSGETPIRARNVTIGSMMLAVQTLIWSVNVVFSGWEEGVLMGRFPLTEDTSWMGLDYSHYALHWLLNYSTTVPDAIESADCCQAKPYSEN
jgi:hypothetical protein